MKAMASVGLRLWTLTTRFLLILFLARLLSPAELGLYGLFVATVSYFSFVVGFDLYTFTTRDLLRIDREQWRNRVRDHFFFVTLMLIASIPVSVLLFWGDLIPIELLWWFYLLLITEHIALEIDRLLIAISENFQASIVLLVRQSLLPTFIILFFLLGNTQIRIELIFLVWLILNFVAIVIGFIFLQRDLDASSPRRIDWRWIQNGIKVSVLFFAGTLLLRLLFTADKQIVSILSGLDVLGVYTFAMSIGGGLTTVLSIAVFQFAYPRLISFAQQGNQITFKKQLRIMIWRTIGISAMVCLTVFFATPLLAAWAGNGIYADLSWLFIQSVLALSLYNLSLIPHYALYALRADRLILITTAGSVVGFVLTIFLSLLLGVQPVLTIILGVYVASGMLLISKYIAYKHTSTNFWNPL